MNVDKILKTFNMIQIYNIFYILSFRNVIFPYEAQPLNQNYQIFNIKY